MRIVKNATASRKKKMVLPKIVGGAFLAEDPLERRVGLKGKIPRDSTGPADEGCGGRKGPEYLQGVLFLPDMKRMAHVNELKGSIRSNREVFSAE